MAKATRTIRQVLNYQPQHAAWFAANQDLFNRVSAFYFEIVQSHEGLLDLSSQEALTALERLTHTTKANPHPPFPLSSVASDLPAMFRRAAIHAALGSARSFYTSLEKWRKRKEQAQARGKKYTIRPPVPPRTWNRSATLYAGMYRERHDSSIMLKLWTGASWVWIKCRVQGRKLPEGWTAGSSQLVERGSQWWLHTPIEQEIERPKKVATQLTTDPTTKICAIDMNLDRHIAVCTIQTVEGTVLSTRFIGEGKETHGLRKRLLGKIAGNRSKTGILAEGEQDNVRLWAKVRCLDEQTAHLVSHRIVAFAKAHHARILVFEHLGNLKPEKGRYSRRANNKRMYWLKGRIFAYAKYKAWNAGGIVTCRVSPRNTSRECARCHASVARYAANHPTEGYTPGAPLVSCAHCGMRDHADRNASIVIGQRLISHYQPRTQEKPHAPLLHAAERPAKAGGVVRSQDAERGGRPSTNPARHGQDNGHGTAQDGVYGMAHTPSGIPSQLRLFVE